MSDLFFHPVRLRVIQQLLGEVQQTTGVMATAMPDVPVTSLYRHIGILIDAGVVEVIDERRIRGVVERTLRLAPMVGTLNAEELAEMTPENLRHSFAGFAAGLVAAFNRYTEASEPDVARDQVSYRQVSLWLSDSELSELTDEVSRCIAQRTANQAGTGRRKRLISQIIIPVTGHDTEGIALS